jgi:hypothetical protein
MKICTICKIPKLESEFDFTNKATGTLHYYCKECQRPRSRQSYLRNKHKYKDRWKVRKDIRIMAARHFIYEYKKTHPCGCGESDPRVLDFDHDIQNTKVRPISQMIQTGVIIKRLQLEVDKCTVRCANCHRKRTSEQLNHYAWLKSSEYIQFASRLNEES